ncbi:hypothetical protein ACFJIV_29080 [Mucilaginibacter sp. UC70_90]
MKQQTIFSDTPKGINLYRVWTGHEVFYIYTQRGWPTVHLALSLLRKAYGEAYITSVPSTEKRLIREYFK